MHESSAESIPAWRPAKHAKSLSAAPKIAGENSPDQKIAHLPKIYAPPLEDKNGRSVLTASQNSAALEAATVRWTDERTAGDGRCMGQAGAGIQLKLRRRCGRIEIRSAAWAP